MTVDQQLELHSQLGKALNYVRQGIKILCLEDNDRMQKLTYTEDDVLSWQQRYFELQEENKSLHKLLVSKDDVLNLALHSSGSNKMLYNQVRENEITMRKHIGLLNQVMEESNKTCSDLFISSAQYARTITNLESEVSHWRLIATEQQCELTKSKEMLTLLSWNLCHLPQSFEVEPPNSEHFNAFNETALDAMGQLIHESQRIKKELHYAQSKYAALFEQNRVLQKEYEKQSQHIFDMNIIQEKMENALQTHQNVLQSLLRGLSSTQLHLKNTQAEYASLKSTNEELCNELEIQKYRNDALDEVSRELASKVQSGTIVDLQKFQQLQQEKTDLQSVLADTESKRDSAIQRLLESDARLQKMEAKCQALQESLDNDDQIRLKYRVLFKELEESLSSNKKLKDVNDMLENSVKTLTTELETAIKQCSVSQTALEDLIKEHASFQEQANSESKVNGERINDLQLSLEKQLSLENELRSQLRNEIERVAEMQAFKTSLADDLHSTNAALSILQSQYDDIKVNFDRINHENECLAAQVESAEVAKSVALDMVASTKSQLMEAESREHVLNDAIESLNLTIAKMTENAALTSDEKLALASDLDLRNEEYVSLKKELEEVSEYMATLKQQVDSFKESLTRASLQHVEDAEQIENLQSELKNSKARLEKLQDVNKMLQQDLPSSQTDDSVILREKSKTKALSKQVATLKKKSKDLEKDCQRWKALYEKELVGKALT